MDNLEKFVTDLLAGSLEPHMKSEAVPDNTDKPVKVRDTYILNLYFSSCINAGF